MQKPWKSVAIDLFPKASLAFFPTPSRTTHPGEHYHCGVSPPTPIINEKMHYRLSMNQSYGGFFSIESPFFHMTLACVKLA